MRELLQTLNQTPFGYVYSALLGLLWGSFYNVCICRIPAGESVAKHRSRCPRCAAPILWYHNVPVLSFLMLRGRCSSCRERISIQYPLVELATGALFVLLFHLYGFSLPFLCYGIFTSMLLIISVIDFHHRIIPDELSLPGIVLGFLASIVLGEISWWESLLGIVAGGGIFWSIAWGYEKWSGREGLGGGDVKLLAMIGAWLGIKSILVVIIISSALGSFAGIGLMLVQRRNLRTAIPFGPFLAVAAAVYLIWGHPIRAFLMPEVP